MTGILVVCTGNVCRSPMAEGFLRRSLARRLGDDAPPVSSAGTHGWERSPATPEAVEAARERGAAIQDHRARVLTGDLIDDADLVLCMTREHRDAVVGLRPAALDRTFTLKELAHIVDRTSPNGSGDAIEAAVAARRQGVDDPDQDVADPLGQPYEAYRGVAWELDTLIDRLVQGLYGQG